MPRYSFLNNIRHALSGHRYWTPAWRSAKPKSSYDVVIIGGGGHGLATGDLAWPRRVFSRLPGLPCS